jgi:hypothetical protein
MSTVHLNAYFQRVRWAGHAILTFDTLTGLLRAIEAATAMSTSLSSLLSASRLISTDPQRRPCLNVQSGQRGDAARCASMLSSAVAPIMPIRASAHWRRHFRSRWLPVTLSKHTGWGATKADEHCMVGAMGRPSRDGAARWRPNARSVSRLPATASPLTAP